MSIEADLKRIADALEVLVNLKKERVDKLLDVADQLTLDTPAPAAPAAPAAPTPAAPAPAPAPAAPAPALMSADELNTELGKEFVRLGNRREPIDNVMKSMGVTSVTQLTTAEQQQTLLASVRATQA